MAKLDITLLEKIMNIPSPSGFTSEVIAFLKTYCEALGYQTALNHKGNLFITVTGKTSDKLGLSAHVDTLGLMVRSIGARGEIYFTKVGGPLLSTYDGEYCHIYTRDGKRYTGTVLSTSPSVHVFKDASSKQRDEENMYIRLDELVYTKQDVTALGIQNGDFISILPKFTVTPAGFIKTRFLDDKASVFILLEVLKYVKENDMTPVNTLIFMFTTYEEVGHGCSSIPDMKELLAVDMGCIGLDLSCTEEMVSICAKDGSGPYDYDMTTTLINLAKENGLNYAVDIYPYYSSDASAALRGGNDIKCALIGAGIAASHGMERTHIHALENTFQLVLAYIQK